MGSQWCKWNGIVASVGGSISIWCVKMFSAHVQTSLAPNSCCLDKRCPAVRAHSPQIRDATKRLRSAERTCQTRLSATKEPEKYKLSKEELFKIDTPNAPVEPNFVEPKRGFVENAEVMNSRWAIIGFMSLCLVEGLFNKPFLRLFGMRIGPPAVNED